MVLSSFFSQASGVLSENVCNIGVDKQNREQKFIYFTNLRFRFGLKAAL